MLFDLYSGYFSDYDIFTLVSPAVFLINKVYFPLSSSDTLVILRVVVYPSPPSSSSSTVMITLSPNKQKCNQKLRECKQTPKYKQTQLKKIPSALISSPSNSQTAVGGGDPSTLKM